MTKQAEREGDPEYLDFVRSFPCCACGASAPSHAHHEILNGRGKSQKAPDSRSMPFCFTCHGDFHRVRGKFRGWTKEQRRDYQDTEITRLRSVWDALQAHGFMQEPERIAI